MTTNRSLVASLLLLLLSATYVEAQQGRGFSEPIARELKGEELLNQEKIWAMDISLKPLRMIKVQVTDPKTGEKKEQLVWYLVYKAMLYPVKRPQPVVDRELQNVEDIEPKELFTPEFVLITDDNDGSKIYRDDVIPEALKAINIRERAQLKHSVQLVQNVPEPDAEADKKAIYGVAMWKAVNPETDFFTIYMHGFSNGYRIRKGPDGEPLMFRRVLSQEYWRPGDELDEDESEIRLKGKPVWQYLPEPAKAE